MRVQIKKGRDGRSTLTCVRADGSRTWHQVHPFFPVHDLTHFAVESVLGFRAAFFGLVASGWDLDAFADRARRARMPDEAVWAETIVGVLDLERGQQRMFDPSEFRDAVNAALAGQGRPPFRPLAAGELARIRTVRGGLRHRWLALAPGETLDLAFPVSAEAPSPR